VTGATDREAIAAALVTLHDATLIELKVDWARARVVISVKRMDRRMRFTLERVSRVECPHEEPWGPSASINAACATVDGVELEMQSGDVIRIVGVLQDLVSTSYVGATATGVGDDEISLWADHLATRRSTNLPRTFEVTGVRRKALGPRLDIAEVSLLVEPADHLEKRIAIEGIALSPEQRDFLDWALLGFLDVVLTAGINPLRAVRVTVTNALFDPIHANVTAFQLAGRDAGRKLLAALDAAVDAERESRARRP
jgi:hypothetical protein